MRKKGILFWLVDFKGEPFPNKKGKKGTTTQLGEGGGVNPVGPVKKTSERWGQTGKEKEEPFCLGR